MSEVAGFIFTFCSLLLAFFFTSCLLCVCNLCFAVGLPHPPFWGTLYGVLSLPKCCLVVFSDAGGPQEGMWATFSSALQRLVACQAN